MKINREQLLNDLEMVKAGVSPREFVEQSSCFAFKDGMVMTFNDEIACRKECALKVEGAVQASALLTILGQLTEDDLEVEQDSEQKELVFQGKRKRFGIVMDAEIFLPIDRVETPEKWRKLPPEFTEAVGLVQHCVSADENRFLLTCVHLSPESVEACDNLQAMRCRVTTGLKSDVLVRGTSLRHITSLAMNEVALTEAWIHFRNPSGLIYSCRRYSEEYPALEPLFKIEGHPVVIPKGLSEASTRAAVFASDKSGDPLMTVSLKDGKVRVRGEGLAGWYEEVKKIAYHGPLIEFLISPELLKYVSEHYSDAQINGTKLKVHSGTWDYVTVLAGVKAPEKTKE